MLSFTNVTRPFSGFNLSKFQRLRLPSNLSSFTRGFASRQGFRPSSEDTPFSRNFAFRRGFSTPPESFVFCSSPGLCFIFRRSHKMVSSNGNSLMYSHKSLNMSTLVKEDKQQEHL
ncbi:7766_t:CDS:1, partial [Dentiscutata heterogama]